MQRINWKSFLFAESSKTTLDFIEATCVCLFVWCVSFTRVSRQCSVEPRKSTQAMLSNERRRCKWLFPVPFSQQQQRTLRNLKRHMKRNHCVMGFIIHSPSSSLVSRRDWEKPSKAHQTHMRFDYISACLASPKRLPGIDWSLNCSLHAKSEVGVCMSVCTGKSEPHHEIIIKNYMTNGQWCTVSFRQAFSGESVGLASGFGVGKLGCLSILMFFRGLRWFFIEQQCWD